MTAVESVTTDRRVSNRTLIAGGAIVVSVVTLAYLLLFWNHFAGLRSGSGEYMAGTSWLEGYLPYRDYFTPAPPLNILKSALLLSTFGKAYIVTRAFAVVERTLLGVLLYFWLVRMFRPSHAALAAMVTIIVSTGDVADPLASYNHDAIFFAVFAGFLASFVLDPQRKATTLTWFAIGCGICAGLSFATKQTIGLGVSVAVPVIVCASLASLEGFTKAVSFLAAFSLGWAIPAGSLILWLSSQGILSNFWEQVFVRGPAAKASSPGDFLVRELVLARHLWWAAAAGVVGIVLCWSSWSRSARQDEHRADTQRQILSVLLLGVAAVAIGYAVSTLGVQHARGVLKPVVYFTFIAVAILPLVYGVSWLRGMLSRRESQFLLFAAVGFSVAFMLSLSFPVFEAMMVPGLGLLVAALLDGSKRVRLIAWACCAFLIASETCAKLNLPFGFDELDEPSVHSAHTTSTLPALRGFVLPESTVRFIDETTRIIEQNSSPTDTIFSYPDFLLFYALSGRSFPTLTDSHNMDVVNDDFARSEAARISSKMPAVLISHPQNESYFAFEEWMWRHGRPSGNRSIMAAVENLEKRYRLAASFKLADGYRVDVYVRPNRLR